MKCAPFVIAILVVGPSLLGPTAAAAINPGATALQIGQAIFANPALVTGAVFVAKPPQGTPDAVSTTPLTSFPTSGADYGILTTGDATIADTPNGAPDSGANDGGGNVRGNTDYDVTILRVDFQVQTGNCLKVDFQFFSEEFPEFVGSAYNDAFIAELDTTTWSTAGSAITAPDNFAFDSAGNPITINAAGGATMNAGNAAGTTYDGATPLLTASTPINPGAHSVFFSIFDQGDQAYDSAVFLDNLVVVTQEDCEEGVVNPPPVSVPYCEAYGIKVVERDATGLVGDLDADFSRSAVTTSTGPGAPPVPAPTPATPPFPPNPAAAHADAQQLGFDYTNPATGLRVSAKTIHSRCDVVALNGYEQAYGRGGLQDLDITLGATSILHLEALDFEAMAVGQPALTFMTTDCDILEVSSTLFAPVSACPAPTTVSVPPGVLMTLNEQWGPNPVAAGAWGYGGTVLHVRVLVPGVSDIEVCVGLVNLGVTGGGPIGPGPAAPACA